ncbi:MAG: hypothetical protein Q9159_007486 [Coniocarpon cinnabarinum]
MSQRGQPHLLFSLPNVQAFHIQNGQDQSLTPAGPQNLSLLMVSSASPFDDLSNTIPQNEAPEEDFYLHLHLPPELELPLPATTQIFHQPPRSYLIPRWDLGPDSGAFTRIDFPEKVTQDEVDTFETILAQCTAFLERAPPPTGDAKHQPYNPADYAAGGKYAGGKTRPGQIVLIDEDDGSTVGELGEGAQIIEDPKLSHGNKNPVEIEVDADGRRVNVYPVSEDYLRMSKHPAYRDSSLVQNAASASRLIVTGSSYLGNLMSSSAESFTQKTNPNDKPLTFSTGTHERMRKLHSFTNSGAAISSKTVGSAPKYAQNMGAKVTNKKRKDDKAFDAQGNPASGYKPGFLNKSMIAFSTVMDGVAQSGRDLLTQSGAAASTVIGHRYGAEAGTMAARMAGGVKNVGLVYIDVTGVSRRAVIKSVAKGMVVGEVKGGGQVVVGGGDGGTVPESDVQRMAQDASGRPAGVSNDRVTTGVEPQIAEFGTARRYASQGTGDGAPPYTSDLGEPMGSSSEKARPPQV